MAIADETLDLEMWDLVWKQYITFHVLNIADDANL
jgi:hypothetical protein